MEIHYGQTYTVSQTTRNAKSGWLLFFPLQKLRPQEVLNFEQYEPVVIFNVQSLIITRYCTIKNFDAKEKTFVFIGVAMYVTYIICIIQYGSDIKHGHEVAIGLKMKIKHSKQKYFTNIRSKIYQCQKHFTANS